jgi:cadmium resistance protein CadD (predicted permease)
METIIILSIFALFLYFGYKDDFKRNSIEFSRGLFGTILAITSMLLVFFILMPHLDRKKMSALLGLLILIPPLIKWLTKRKALTGKSDKTEEE